MAESNVEPLEPQLMLKEGSNRTEHKTEAEPKTAEIREETLSRKRLLKYDEEYQIGTPSPAGSSGNGEAALEKEPEPVPEIELDEFLDKLHRRAQTLTHSKHDKPPPSVSYWNGDYNDKTIRKYFKMKLRTLTPDDFVARYLFDGDEELFNVSMLRSAAEMEPVLNYLDESISFIDFTEEDLFFKFSNERSQRIHRETTSEFIDNSFTARSQNLSHLLHGVSFNLCLKMSNFLALRVHDWVVKLSSAVERDPYDVGESVYEEVFKEYLKVFGWVCDSGNASKLGIPYGDGQVFIAPHILARKTKHGHCAVVEVKKMTSDPNLKYAVDKKGILRHSDKGLKPPKIKRVSVNLESEGTSTVEQSEEDKSKDDPEDVSDLGESPVSASQRKFIKLFFGQLFGSVLALDCTSPSPHLKGYLPRLGIGVVGFRVVFFSFCANPPCHFKDIPRNANSQMNVYMTSELSLLKASDRRKINQILLPLSVMDPKPC